jgi:hypothetical protein
MLCADPDERLPVWLDSDKEKPKETRPTFFIRALTQQELREGARFVTQAKAKDVDNEKCSELLDKAIAVGLIGWENIIFRGTPVPFSAETRTGSFLSAGEVWQLSELVLDGQALTEGDRGNSSAPSTTEVGGSVASAEQKVGV